MFSSGPRAALAPLVVTAVCLCSCARPAAHDLTGVYKTTTTIARSMLTLSPDGRFTHVVTRNDDGREIRSDGLWTYDAERAELRLERNPGDRTADSIPASEAQRAVVLSVGFTMDHRVVLVRNA